jgi:hypothetical protein
MPEADDAGAARGEQRPVLEHGRAIYHEEWHAPAAGEGRGDLDQDPGLVGGCCFVQMDPRNGLPRSAGGGDGPGDILPRNAAQVKLLEQANRDVRELIDGQIARWIVAEHADDAAISGAVLVMMAGEAGKSVFVKLLFLLRVERVRREFK